MKAIRIEEDVYQLLIAKAKAEDRSLQSTINRFLRAHLMEEADETIS